MTHVRGCEKAAFPKVSDKIIDAVGRFRELGPTLFGKGGIADLL